MRMLELTVGHDLHDRAMTLLKQCPVTQAFPLPPTQRRADALELTQDPRAPSRVALLSRDVALEFRGITQDPLDRWIRSCLDCVPELRRTGIAVDPPRNQRADPQRDFKIPPGSIHTAMLPEARAPDYPVE